MDRRGFLKLFGAASTADIVAPTYFFAPTGGWNPTGLFAGTPDPRVDHLEMIEGGNKRYCHLTYAMSTRVAWEMIDEQGVFLRSDFDKLLSRSSDAIRF